MTEEELSGGYSINMANIITEQSGLFLISMLYGVILGVWYDFFRVLRKRITHKNRFVHAEDVIFCFSAAAGLFILFQVYNQGRIRFFVLLGLEIGSLLYFFLFGRIVEKGISLLIEIFCLGLSILQKCVGTPVKLIVKSILNILKKTWRTVRIIKSRK